MTSLKCASILDLSTAVRAPKCDLMPSRATNRARSCPPPSHPASTRCAAASDRIIVRTPRITHTAAAV